MDVFKSTDAAWEHLLAKALTQKVTESRNGPMRELVAQSFVITDSRRTTLTQPCRKFSKKYAAAEFIWYLTGSNSVEMISHYAPSYTNYANEHGLADGAYGKRWFYQIPELLNHLRDNPDSRRAVLATFDGSDSSRLSTSKDIPCTLSLQFLVRAGKLDCIATMRSNDLWLGMPYDVFCFTTLQKVFAAHLSLLPGKYYHQAGSLHLYEKDVCKLEKLVKVNDLLCLDNQLAPYHEGTFARTKKILIDGEKALRKTGKIPLEFPQCSPLMGDLLNWLIV